MACLAQDGTRNGADFQSAVGFLAGSRRRLESRRQPERPPHSAFMICKPAPFHETMTEFLIGTSGSPGIEIGDQ